MDEILNHNYPNNKTKKQRKPTNLLLQSHSNAFIDKASTFSRLINNNRLHTTKNSQQASPDNQNQETQTTTNKNSYNKPNLVLKQFHKKKDYSHNPLTTSDYNLSQSVKNLRSTSEERALKAQGMCDKSKHLVDYLNKDGKIATSREIKVSMLSSNIFHVPNVNINNKN